MTTFYVSCCRLCYIHPHLPRPVLINRGDQELFSDASGALLRALCHKELSVGASTSLPFVEAFDNNNTMLLTRFPIKTRVGPIQHPHY